MKQSGNQSKRRLGSVRFKKREQREEPHQSTEKLDTMLRSHPNEVANLSERTAGCVNRWVGEITEKEKKVEEYKSKAEDLVQSSTSLNELKSRAGTIKGYADEVDRYAQPVDVDSQLILDTLLETEGKGRHRKKNQGEVGCEHPAADEAYGSVYSLYGEMGTKKRRLRNLRPLKSNE